MTALMRAGTERTSGTISAICDTTAVTFVTTAVVTNSLQQPRRQRSLGMR